MKAQWPCDALRDYWRPAIGTANGLVTTAFNDDSQVFNWQPNVHQAAYPDWTHSLAIVRHLASVACFPLRNIAPVFVAPVFHFTGVIQGSLVLELAASTVKK